MSDLIRAKLKEVVKLQYIIKEDNLNFKSKRERTYNFGKYSLPIVFLRDIHEGNLSIEKADNKQSNFAYELKNFEKSTKTLEKKSLLNNLGLLFSAREQVFNSFKSRLDKIPTREPTPEAAAEPTARTTPNVATEATITKHKKYKLKLQQEFMNEIIADEKDINNEIFRKYFNDQNPLFLIKGSISAKQYKNEKILNNINDRLTCLRNNINRKEMPKMKIQKKKSTLL